MVDDGTANAKGYEPNTDEIYSVEEAELFSLAGRNSEVYGSRI